MLTFSFFIDFCHGPLWKKFHPKKNKIYKIKIMKNKLFVVIALINHAFFAQISSVQVDELVNRTIKLLMFPELRWQSLRTEKWF
jgi:hypothetical protein